MSTFIVATDFSKEAENALEYAGALAKQIKAKVILFNSYSIPIHAANSLLSAASYQELIDHNNHILKVRAKKLADAYSIEAGCECGLMDLTNELESMMVKHSAKFVVMGMAPKSLEQDLFGNTTTSAIMRLKFPVLAVPYTSKFEGIKKILFACDDIQDQGILNRIKEVASSLSAEVEVFYVSKRIDNLKAAARERSAMVIDEVLADVPHYYKNVESGEVIKEIENEINNISADLLIMLPRKYGFLESVLHRSKTRIMASNNSVPMLSIPMLGAEKD